MDWTDKKVSLVAAYILIIGHITIFTSGVVSTTIGVVEVLRMIELLVVHLPAIAAVTVPWFDLTLQKQLPAVPTSPISAGVAAISLVLLSLWMLYLTIVLLSGLRFTLNGSEVIYFIAGADAIMLGYISCIKNFIFNKE